MDKQSKLIFEAYQSLRELVDLVEFVRNVSNTNSKTRFDAFVFKDKNTKKKYTLHQIVMREDGGEPEIFGTTIFDNARDADVDGMIFHTIDKYVHLHGLGDIKRDSTIKNHKFFDEDKLGWDKVREMIHKAFAMTEKQRRVKEYGMKPETEDKFKDILSNLGEGVKAIRAAKLPKVEIMALWRDEDQYHQGTDELLLKVGNEFFLTREFYEEIPNILVGVYYFVDPKFKKQKDGTYKITHEGENFYDFMGDRNRLKKWTDRSRQEVINFQHDPEQYAQKSYKHGVTSIDPDVVAINDFLLKFNERERQVYLLKIKPKTAEHFGDIMGGLS